MRTWTLLITRNFPPLVGGMEKVNLHLLRSLEATWKVSLCGPRGSRMFTPDGTVVSETSIRPLLWFLVSTVLKAARLSLKLRPRLVFAGSGLTAPIAWLVGRMTVARVVVYLHGLDLIAPSWVYQRFWIPFIRNCDVVIVNSGNTARLARERGVDGAKVFVLHPGTSIPTLEAFAGPAFRADHGLSDQAVLLSVGRLTRRKGLVEFISSALPLIISERPDAILVVIGDEATDALHAGAGSERERILEAAQTAGVERNVLLLGRCDEEALGAAYQAADCHVFPVLDMPGDVEGFGMVALESAAHGLPTVAFDVGGVSDAVDQRRSGQLVRAGDYASMAVSVLAVLNQPRTESTRQACRAFALEKSWDRFGERLRHLVTSEND